MTLLLGFDNLLQRLTEFRKTVYLLDCWFIIKGYNSGIAKWPMHRARYMGRGAEPFMPPPGGPFSQHPHELTNPSSLNPICQGLLWRLHYTGMTDDLCYHWPLASDSTSSPSPLPGQGWGPKVPTLSTGSPSNQPSSCGYQGAF